MSESKKIFTLSTILKRVKTIVDTQIKGRNFWLKVELANITRNAKSGHVYLELTESKNGFPIAKSRGIMWHRTFLEIRAKLGDDVFNILVKGHEVLLNASLEFSELYGLQIFVHGLDIEFSLGQLEKRKQATIKRLTDEKLIDKNKNHVLPMVLQKIAIIGSPRTSGFTDFFDELRKNKYGYEFEIVTYSSSVQGEKAKEEIINRLKELNELKYDVVVLLRGGGSKLDLDVFNDYDIAKEIALHNLPVLTGIGHETDFCVADIVANKHLKTPTAIANFIIETAMRYESNVIETFDAINEAKELWLLHHKNKLVLAGQKLVAQSEAYTRLRRGEFHQVMNRLVALGNRHIVEEKEEIIQISNNFVNHSRLLLHSQKKSIENLLGLLIPYYEGRIGREKVKLNLLNEMLPMLSVQNILNKGFVIPFYKDQLYLGEPLAKGEEVELKFVDKSVLLNYIKEKNS